ncbi:Ribonuclease P protein subunit p14 [Mactra antiquata]
MYQKIVTKGSTDYCYLKIRLDFGKDHDAIIDALNFKQLILSAAKDVFGIAVSCSLIDVLRYEKSSRTAVIRIYHKYLTKLWSSLTMYGNINGAPCAFRILQVSSHLMALANNSRSMKLHMVYDG